MNAQAAEARGACALDAERVLMDADEHERNGPADPERAEQPLINTVGCDTLPQLLALERADVLSSPDSGGCTRRPQRHPERFGLYAVTNLQRAQSSRSWCVNNTMQRLASTSVAGERNCWNHQIENWV